MSAPSRIDDAERRRRIGVRHRLGAAHRTDDITTIADSLVALHASDPPSVYRSAWARMITPTIDAVDVALYDDRSLIRHHAMRRTIWVMTRPVTTEANISSTRKIAAVERRKLLQWLAASDEVSEPDRWLADAIDQVVDAIRAAGTLTTRELGRQLPDLAIDLTAAPGTKWATPVAAHTRVPFIAAIEGRLVRARPIGGWTAGQYRWAVADDWAPGLDLAGDTMSTADASAAMMRRLLTTFGPATATDLQWWTGWTKTQTAAAIDAVGATAVTLQDGSDAWTADGDDQPTQGVDPWIALLPALDPTTMGWKDRHWYLDDDIAARVFDRNGNAGPTIWADGRVIGGWVQRRDGEIALELLRDVSRDHRVLLDAEVERLTTVVGDARFTVRFPTPSSRDLAG